MAICELNGKPCIYPDKNCNVYCEVFINTDLSKRIEVQERLEKENKIMSQTKKGVTNADRIRSMNNEELAEFLCQSTECGSCRYADWTGCLVREWLEELCEE